MQTIPMQQTGGAQGRLEAGTGFHRPLRVPDEHRDAKRDPGLRFTGPVQDKPGPRLCAAPKRGLAGERDSGYRGTAEENAVTNNPCRGCIEG